MKFSIKDFFSKSDQIHRKLRIWSHLLKKYLTENFIFCAVLGSLPIFRAKKMIHLEREREREREIPGLRFCVRLLTYLNFKILTYLNFGIQKYHIHVLLFNSFNNKLWHLSLFKDTHREKAP